MSIAPSSGSNGKLLCSLTGGITNQAIEAQNCIAIAALVGYALVLPRPRIVTNTIYAGARFDTAADWNSTVIGPGMWMGEGTADMATIWSVAQFMSVAEKAGVRLVEPTGTERPSLAAFVPQSLKRWRFATLASDGSIQHVGRHEQLQRAPMPSPSSVLHKQLRDHRCALIMTPMNTLITSSSPCCQPSERIQRMVVQERQRLPKHFACLHLRVEMDWLIWCCSGGLSNRQGWLGAMQNTSDAATLAGRGMCPDGSKPDGGCYRNVAQVTEWLLETVKLARGTTLYVATGASLHALAPLMGAFDVRLQAPTGRAKKDMFMDYSAALLQSHVCSLADRFYGKRASSFTREILRIRHNSLQSAGTGLRVPKDAANQVY